MRCEQIKDDGEQCRQNARTGKRRKTCGHFGGVTAAGTPCTRKIGWGTDHPGEGACKDHNGSRGVLAFAAGIVQKPQSWDKAVAAAFLWLVTGKIKGSAEGAGISERALKMWIKSPWWGDACEEAKKKWLNTSMAWARKGLLENIKRGDAASQRWLLERTDMLLAPPAQQHEIFVDYLHRTDVVELARGMAMDVMEVVTDPEMRAAIAERFRLRLEHHTGNSRKGGQHQLPPGNTEGGEV